MREGKLFTISQIEVLNAYKAVKANKGAGGVDGVKLEEFDKNRKNNLYTLWTRMSSGSYFPQQVKGRKYPRKSALEAIGTARKKGFQMKWVVTFDMVGFFDTIDHGQHNF